MIGFFETHIHFRFATAWTAIVAMLSALLLPAVAHAQAPDGPPAFNRKQIEQLVAPIALYPDGLLTQVLMASTYPLEVVQAARWREQNPGVTGSDLEGAMQDQGWDESVRALTAFPQVLTMMNDKLDWTQKLGEAFLAQQDDVFAAVQDLRRRAQSAGSLKDIPKMRIVDQPADNGPAYIEIEPAAPDEIYVPVYDPVTVYGAWPYDDYPPYYWYPHGWNRDHVFWFGSAVVLGVAMWAAWDWRNRHIRIDERRFNAFNRTKLSNPTWAFRPQHRAGVPFKAPLLSKKFGPIPHPTPAQRATLKQHLNPGFSGKPGGIGAKPGSMPINKIAPVTPGTGTPHQAHKPLIRDNPPRLKNVAPVHKDIVKPKEHTFVKPNNVPRPHVTQQPKVHVQRPAVQHRAPVQHAPPPKPVSRPPPPKKPVDQKH